jgi:parvulin-like peptidyl-prolyl isomerase
MFVRGRRRASLAAVTMAVLALAIVACSNSNDDRTALRVDGWALARVEFDDTLNQIAGNQGYLDAHGTNAGPLQPRVEGTDGFAPQFMAEFANERVTFQLAAAEVARRGLEITDEDRQRALEVVTQGLATTPVSSGIDPVGQQVLDQFGSYRSVLLDGVTNLQVLRRDLTKDVDRGTEARNLYDVAGEQFSNQVCVRQIVFQAGPDANDKANAAVARVRGGESVDAVARDVSEDLNSKAQGGDFGCVPRGTFDQPVEDAAWAVPVGQVSDPVDNRDSLVLVYVSDRRVFTFDELEPRLLALVDDQLGQRVNDWLSGATREASVWVNSAYGTWNEDKGVVDPVGGPATLELTPGTDP